MNEAPRQPVQALGAVIVLWIAAYWVRSPAGSAMPDEAAFAPAPSMAREVSGADSVGAWSGGAHGGGADGETGTVGVREEADRAAGVDSAEVAGASRGDGARIAEFDWSPGAPESSPESGGAAEGSPVVRTHTVRRGDTLGSIALRAYGSVRYADAIYRANREVLRSPDALDVGMVLTLPETPAP